MPAIHLTRGELEKIRQESYELPNDVLTAVPDPLVSVRTSTYNHGSFIQQCIEGVLAQKTPYAVEYIIGEDFSTDATRKVVFDYASRYPNLIRVITADRNVGMKGNAYRTRAACRGQYVALCEGDDYWTDPLKLQKQVDFLEAHPDHSLCFHPVYRLLQTTGEMQIWRFRHKPAKSSLTLDDVIRGASFIRTGSIMFRRHLVAELPDWFYRVPIGDWPRIVLLAHQGRIGFIDQPMSVYRVHQGGLCSGASVLELHRAGMATVELVRQHLDPKYEKLIRCHISDRLLTLSWLSADGGDLAGAKNYFRTSMSECPLNRDMRILERLVLFGRLYAPPLYKALKYVQTGLRRTGKHK